MGSDGAGLFCGILKHFIDRGLDCPKILAATHFHEVFKADLFDPEKLPVTFLHMQVMFTTTDGDIIMDKDVSFSRNRSDTNSEYQEEDARIVGPGEKITYLYKYANEMNLSIALRLIVRSLDSRVANGLCFNSHAAKCAEIFGVPQRVVERARYVTCVQLHLTLNPSA